MTDAILLFIDIMEFIYAVRVEAKIDDTRITDRELEVAICIQRDEFCI